MKKKLSFVALAAAIGPFVGGLIWLGAYAMNIGTTGFDGKAIVIMLLTMFAGWAAFSGTAIFLYCKANAKPQLLKAILLAVGIGAVALGSAALNYVRSVNH